MTATIYMSYVLSGLWVIVGIGMMFSNTASSSSIWMLINVYQMMLFLPLTGAYIHPYVFQFIKGIDFSILNFSILDNTEGLLKINFMSYFDCTQQNDYLNDIGLQSWSTIINISLSVLFDIWIMIIHILLYLFYLCVKSNRNCFSKFVFNLLKVMTFSVYIRKLLESFLLFSISTTQELYLIKPPSASRTISFWFALLLFLFLWWTSIFVLAFHSKSIEVTFNDRMYWIRGIYEAFKQNRASKLYFFVFIIRRLALTCWISFGQSLPKFVRIIIFWLLQIPSLPYIIYWRPYLKTKENICEILNEVIYSLLCIFLIFVNSESRWTNTLAFIIISILIANSLWINAILLIFVAIKICCKCCNRLLF